MNPIAAVIIRRAELIWSTRRRWLGKAIGALFGLAGGLIGSVIGFLIGHMVDELLLQWYADRSYAAYLDNPGASDFPEPAAGSAAFCALGAMVMAGDSALRSGQPIVGPEDVERIVDKALSYFALDADCRPIAEAYVNQALNHYKSINIDLLAESLAARRSERGDGALLADALFSFADDKASAAIAERAAIILDAGCHFKDKNTVSLEAWELLGVKPGTPIDQVKLVFRQLVSQFHPDTLSGLDEDRVRQSAEAFMRIENAYRSIISNKRDEIP